MQCIVLVPPEMWENHSQTLPPPSLKMILNSKDQSYNKWTKVRLYQDSFLSSEKQKRGPIPKSILYSGVTQPSFKRNPKRKRIIGPLPLFKTETLDSESEEDSFPVHSKYVSNVLKRKVS